MNPQNPVGWFEIYVQDMDRATQFYQDVLGVEMNPILIPDANIEMMQFPQNMEGSGTSGALIKVEGVPSGGNSTLVYFTCEDCAIEAKRVKAHGGVIKQEKMAVGEYGFVVLAVDTEQNMFGLFSAQ